MSLVDKVKMRSLHNVVLENLKMWYKANLAQRVANAAVGADIIAREALASGKVKSMFSLSFHLMII